MSDGMSDSRRAEREQAALRALARQIKATFDEHGDVAFPEAFADFVSDELRLELRSSLRLVTQDQLDNWQRQAALGSRR